MFFQTLFHLSRLHILQFARLLREIGPARIVILTIALFIFINQFEPLINFQSPWIGLIVYPFVFAFAGIKGENTFLSILGMPVLAMKFARNVIFASPAIIMLLFNQSWTGLSLAFAVLLLSSFLPISVSGQFQFPGFKFGLRLLPWTVGLRSSLLFIAVSVFLSLAGVLHLVFSFAAMFVFHFIVLGFFNHNEPPHILESYALDAGKFLRFYTSKHLLYYSLSQMAFVIVGTAFHPHILVVFATIGTLLVLHQWLTLNLKFAFYEPGVSNESMQSLQTLMLIFFLIPFTLPIPFWYLWKYRKKALDNLKLYLP